VLAVALAGCRGTPKETAGEPSLQETQAWMHSFAADRGAGATYEGSGCSGAVTWLETDGSLYYTFSFSLKDLDPESARSVQTVISPPALQNMWRATAVTTNNLKKVAVYNHHTKQNEQDDSVIEGIGFRSSEDADRFAKALRHAIVLCGGKPSPF
jgi:hypothetical protein